MVAHSVGLVPLESPVRYPGTGLHGAKEGFVVQPGHGDQYRLPILWQRARSIPYGKRLYRERHGGGASLSVHSRPSGGQLAPPPFDIPLLRQLIG